MIALYARHRWARVLGVAYPIVTTVVVMATGNHYFLDAVAGAVVIAAGAWLSGRIEAQNPVVVVSGGNVAAETAAAILARR